MSAEITSLAQVTGVELLRVPSSPTANFQEAPPNVVPFPSELDPKEYRQFTLPTGETISLRGFKALYLQALLPTSRDNPLLDSDARNALRRPGEDITPKKLQRRLLQIRYQLEEVFRTYSIRYGINECFHEVSPGELQRAKYLIPLESFGLDEMEKPTDSYIPSTNEAEHSTPGTPETAVAPYGPEFTSIQVQLKRLIAEGKYTLNQIADLIYPEVSLDAARNRLSSQLQRLRGNLFKEGLCIPDGRGNQGGVVSLKSLEEVAADVALHLPGEQNAAPGLPPKGNLPPPPAPGKTVEQPQRQEEEVLAPEDLPSAEIKNPIERRVESRSSGRPKLTLDHAPESPGKINAQIQIPGRGKTRALELSWDEAILFQTLFTSTTSYTHEHLELAMVDIARSDTFDEFGGFERVFNALNKKLKTWDMAIGLNEDKRFVFVNASDKTLTLTPVYRSPNKDIENSGLKDRQRRRQPSYGKQKL